jgi:hypothetical protein
LIGEGREGKRHKEERGVGSELLGQRMGDGKFREGMNYSSLEDLAYDEPRQATAKGGAWIFQKDKAFSCCLFLGPPSGCRSYIDLYFRGRRAFGIFNHSPKKSLLYSDPERNKHLFLYVFLVIPSISFSICMSLLFLNQDEVKGKKRGGN